MALVLRRAVLSNNLSLLRCMKGRPLATAFKINTPHTSLAGTRHRKKGFKKITRHYKTMKLKKQTTAGEQHGFTLKQVMSCPTFAHKFQNIAHDGGNRVDGKSYIPLHGYAMCANTLFNMPATHSADLNRRMFRTSYRNASKKCCPPAQLPPPGPCATPRCMQYMTGYYYYPYGWWFCGPYHVGNQCVPVKCGGKKPPKPKLKTACICPATNVFTDIGFAHKPDTTAISDQNPVSERTAISDKTKGSDKTGRYRCDRIDRYDKIPNQLTTTGSSRTSHKHQPTPGYRGSLTGLSQALNPGPKFPYPSSSTAPPESPNRVLSSALPKKTKYNSSSLTSTTGGKGKNWPTMLSSFLCPCASDFKGFKENNIHSKSCDDYESPKFFEEATENVQEEISFIDEPPLLVKPRELPSRVSRDMPRVDPGVFDYGNVPSFKNPYPHTKTDDNGP